MKKIFLAVLIGGLCTFLFPNHSTAQTTANTNITVVYWNNSPSEDLFNNVTKFYFDNGHIILGQEGILTTIALADIRKLTLEAGVGIESYDQNASILLYPNPATDKLNFATDQEQQITVAVYTIDGRLLLKNKLSTSESLDVSSLSKGLYIIRINEQAYKFSKL